MLLHVLMDTPLIRNLNSLGLFLDELMLLVSLRTKGAPLDFSVFGPFCQFFDLALSSVQP